MNRTRRRHRLTNLQIARVDLVDVPANLDAETGAGAFVRFWKRGREGNDVRLMDVADVRKRGEQGAVIDDVAAVLDAMTPGTLTGTDRGALQRIAKRAAVLAADPADEEDEPSPRRAGSYVAKSGRVHATTGTGFEVLIEKIARAENLSYVDAVTRAAQLDPDAARDYQDRVARGLGR